MTSSDFGARISKVKDRLSFADALEALIDGTDGAGAYDCPSCGGARTLQASRTHTRGGFCRGCDRKFDVLGLQIAVTGDSAREALVQLEALCEELSGGAVKAGASGDLFGKGDA